MRRFIALRRDSSWRRPVLALALAASASICFAEPLVIDGRVDESEWSEAVQCEDWRRTAPFARDEPPYGNRLLLQSTPDGLAAAFVIDHPPHVRRVRPRTPRDSEELSGDSVSLMIDFDARGQVGYEFSVGLGGGVRDGLITNQNNFDRDWDAAWRHAVQETPDQWSVELLIPWSAVGMRSVREPTRTIGVYGSRYLSDRDERYACPGVTYDDPVFLSDFQRVQVARVEAAQAIEVAPYVTVVRDLIADDTQLRGGVDFSWRTSSQLWLTATLNPDFGQVESDELVVDFSAIETVFTDKRPFFTENQAVFDLRTPANGQLIYTRRIGAASDDGLEGSLDIDAALKVTGDAGVLTYGAFGVQEEDYLDVDGRRFAAARLAAAERGRRLGLLTTWTERPLIEREALVNAIDFEWGSGAAWRVAGQTIRSDVEVENAQVHGYETWLQADYYPSAFFTHTLKLLHIDDRFDLNDLGYMERNALRQVEWDTHRRMSGEGAERVNGEVQRFYAVYRENTDGARLQSRLQLSREVQYRTAWRSYQELRYITSGVDDLISRGAGPVQLDERWAGYFDFITPRWGDWQFVLGGYLFQQGVEDYSGRMQFLTIWYPAETLTLRLDLTPELSNDWLLWETDNLFTSYESERLDFLFRIDWIPDPRHELRVKWQWIGVDAQPRQSYRADASGRLLPTAERVSPFTVSNLGLQVRYRYEIAPQSELFVVYGRGGFDLFSDDERGVGDLFGDIGDVRDADQFLFKVRYRF